MSVRLKIEHGQDEGKTWGLKQPGVYVIGRDPANAIRVLDMKVSKGHCEIQVNPGTNGVWLRDLHSTHGTQLNGQPVSRETSLKAGDEIRLGFTVLRLLSDGPSDAAAEPNRAAAAPAPAPPTPGPTPSLAATYTGPSPAPAPAPGPRPSGTPANASSPHATGPQTTGTQAAGPKGNGSSSGAKQPPPLPPQKELPPDELVGKDLAGYKVLKKIGQGGMGAVYIAEQVSLKREVALKVLSEKFVADSAFVDQFLNEARAAGALNHPNVVQVYDVGQADGRYFFSMEFVPGGAIEDKIRAKPAEWRESLNWFLDAANALIFAGKRGILHRDVKPDNLMLAEDGSAKLCDLGLAKKSESADLLAQGIIGTPHFISPEAIRRKPDIDTRTDLYSLGCTFYRIITGQNPYPAATVKDILLGHLNKPVPRVLDKKPDVPKELSDVVFKLMQKDPAERFPDADHLYKALDRIRVQHGLAEHGIQPHSRRPLVIALLMVLAAAAVVGYVVLQPKEPSGPSAEDIKRRADLEEKARLAQEQTDKAERGTFVSEANSRRLLLLNKRASGDIVKTWRDPKWAALIAEFEALKAELLDNPRFGSHADVKGVTDVIDGHVASIKDELATLARVDAQLQQKMAAFAKELGESFEQRLAAFRRSLTEPEGGGPAPWWEAARLMTKEAMRAFVDQSKGKEWEAEGRKFELMNEIERQKLIAAKFPGENWPGEALYLDVLKVRAAQIHGDQILKGTKLAEDGAIPSIQKAAAYLEAYRDALPEPDPSDVTDVSELLRKHRRLAQEEAQKLLAKVQAEVDRLLSLDRSDIFVLIHLLREPAVGVFWTHNFAALDGDPKRLVDGMRSPEYKALAQQLLADARAYEGLFKNLATTFAAKQWTDVELEDSDGKKLKVQEVGPEGLTCPNKVKRSFTEMGPKALLERLFFFGGKERFTFSADDLRGIALMAELAGDREQAQKHWMAYKVRVSGQDPALENAVGKRLSGLALEMDAAKLWFDVKVHHDWLQAFDLNLKLNPPKAPLTPVQRETINRDQFELARRVAEAGQILNDLATREDLASTIWGASIRLEAHPKAAYVGEKLAGDAPPGPSVPPGPPAAPAPAPPPEQKADEGKASEK